jgi:uncharacterized SAM-binding protein YcdF (DUF218 family)
MPLIWITGLLVYSVFTKKDRRSKKLVISSIILILFFGNDFIVNEVLKAWEKAPVPIQKLGTYDYAIVLTGITITEKASESDKVYFAKGADRLLHTVQLYKLGKVKKIIITGGSSSVIGTSPIEALQLKKVFVYCGVPEKDMIIEDKARNTHENALFTKQLCDSLGLQGKFLLVTSAFHMRRSEACFKKVGMQVDIYPVDLFTRDTKFTPNYLFLPLESAFNKWSIFIHEFIGYWVYKIMDYA